jgi:hypothetical protein
LTTKVLALTDALGNLVRFKLLPGQRSEIVGVADLISTLRKESGKRTYIITARRIISGEVLK